MKNYLRLFPLVVLLLFYNASCTQSPKPLPKQKGDSVINAGFSNDTIPEKMVWIPSGTFKMGSDDPAFSDARPVHNVGIKGFWMDEHEVTNAEFERFVRETHYQTDAEQPINPADFTGVPEENLVPGSSVFTPASEPVSYNNPLQWWRYVRVQVGVFQKDHRLQ